MRIPFESVRLRFRPFEEDDFESLRAMHFDVDAMRFLAGGTRADDAAVKRDLAGYLDHHARHGYGKWAAVDKTTGEFLGRAGLVRIEATGEVDLGYAFVKEAWGRGLGSEAGQAILDWAREFLPNARLVGLAKADNVASARILQRIGFRPDGPGHYFGETFDVYRLK